MSGIEKLKQKIMTRLYGTHLTHMHHNRSRVLRGVTVPIKGETITSLAKLFRVSEQDIIDAADELEQEALVDGGNGSDGFFICPTVLAIQRMDFKEKLEELKSETFVGLVAATLETKLKDVDTKDKKAWKVRLTEAARDVVTTVSSQLIKEGIKTVL